MTSSLVHSESQETTFHFNHKDNISATVMSALLNPVTVSAQELLGTFVFQALVERSLLERQILFLLCLTDSKTHKDFTHPNHVL